MIREKKWIAMDKYRRQLFLKFELKRLLLKTITKNESNFYAVRMFSVYKKSILIRVSSKIEQRNRCVITGRVFNVLKKTKYSRFVFRLESYIGNMPGCKKASW